MEIIGITGGTGAGKTTALSVLRDMGAVMADCDEIYHDLLKSSKPMLREISERFEMPEDFDRKELGKRVFGDKNALSDLNAITHKYIKSEIDKAIALAKADDRIAVAIDAVLLFESGLSDKCTFTLGVIASPEVRLARIMEREGVSREYAAKRIASQRDNSFYKEKCDFVLVNDYPTRADFEAVCREFFKNKLGGTNNE